MFDGTGRVALEQDELRRKAEAHDDYLSAMRSMRDRLARKRLQAEKQQEHPMFTQGYVQAFEDFAQEVVQAHIRRLDRREETR